MLREIESRPFVLLLIGLLMGLSFPSISWIFGALAIVFYALKYRPFVLICAAIFVAGFLTPTRSNVLSVSTSKAVVQSFAEYTKDGTVASVRVGEGSFLLKTPVEIALAPGDEIIVKGQEIRPTRDARFNGILAIPELNNVKPGWAHWLAEVRLSAINRLRALYGPTDSPWVTSLTFNFVNDLDKESKDQLRNSGTYHLVSASGMHIWVIAVALHYLFVQLRLLRHHQLPLVFGLLLVYCALTGFHAPTVRAALMWVIGSYAYLFKRSSDGLSALCLSALIWLAFEPLDAFSPSFQLSYLVAGILVLWFERRRLEGMNELRSSLESSLIASVAAEPLAAWWFGRIILVGPISNVLVGMASSFILVLGMLSMIPGLGTVFVWMNRPLIWWVQFATELSAKVPFIKVAPKQLPSWAFAIYFIGIATLILGRRRDARDPFAND